MNKKEKHRQELIPLLGAFVLTRDDRDLVAYLTSLSNLPGPRGNLELAGAFGDTLVDEARRAGAVLWELAANLKKNRPVKNYPEHVHATLELLGQ